MIRSLRGSVSKTAIVTIFGAAVVGGGVPKISNLAIAPLNLNSQLGIPAAWATPVYGDVFRATYTVTGQYASLRRSWRVGGAGAGEFKDDCAVSDKCTGKTLQFVVAAYDANNTKLAEAVSTVSGVAFNPLIVLADMNAIDGTMSVGGGTVTADASARGAPNGGVNLRSTSGTSVYARKTVSMLDATALGVVVALFNNKSRRNLNNILFSLKRAAGSSCTVTTDGTTAVVVTSGTPPCKGDTLTGTNFAANSKVAEVATAGGVTTVTSTVATTGSGSGITMTYAPNYTSSTAGVSSRFLSNGFDGGGVLDFLVSEEDATANPISAQKPAQDMVVQVQTTSNAPHTADVTVGTVLAKAKGIAKFAFMCDDMPPSGYDFFASLLEQYGFRGSYSLAVDKIGAPEDGGTGLNLLTEGQILDLYARGHVFLNDITPTDDTVLSFKTRAEARAGRKKNRDWMIAKGLTAGLDHDVWPYSDCGVLGHPSTVSVNTTAGSAVVTLTAAPVVPLAVGMRPRIAGIGAKAAIKTVDSATQITMDQPSSATASNVVGEFYGTSFNGSVIAALTTTAGSTAVSMGAAPTVTPRVGMEVDANGIPAGTTITAVSGLNLTLSAAATASATVQGSCIETTGEFYDTKLINDFVADGMKSGAMVIGDSFYGRFYPDDLWKRYPRFGLHTRTWPQIKAAMDKAVARGEHLFIFSHAWLDTVPASTINTSKSIITQVVQYAYSLSEAGLCVVGTVPEIIDADMGNIARLPAAA